MADWEWRLVSEESSKSFQFPAVLPTMSDYGGRYAYDDEEPVVRLQFRAANAPLTIRPGIRSAYNTRGGTYTVIDANGETWTGYLTSYRFDPISGCDRMNCEIEITQLITDLSD